ncbi:hypothetical protein RZS08_15115, partial [Arthrospira platensis SPKY1]|nr:hypothetical protein [Arthrospira platensis SPKY1]
YFNDEGIILEADPQNIDHFQNILTFDEKGLLIERKIVKSNGHIHELYRYHGKDTLLSIDQFQNNELLFKTLYTYTASGKLSKYEKKSASGELVDKKEYRFLDGKIISETRTSPGIKHETKYEYDSDVLIKEERWTNQRKKNTTIFTYNSEKQKIKE